MASPALRSGLAVPNPNLHSGLAMPSPDLRSGPTMPILDMRSGPAVPGPDLRSGQALWSPILHSGGAMPGPCCRFSYPWPLPALPVGFPQPHADLDAPYQAKTTCAPGGPGHYQPPSMEFLQASPDPRGVTALLPFTTCVSWDIEVAPFYPWSPILPGPCLVSSAPHYEVMEHHPWWPWPLLLRPTHFCQHLQVPDREPEEELEGTDRPRRVRTMFNAEQLGELEKAFQEKHNLVGRNRAQLAARLNLTENQVRIWFQNRRVKYQKQQSQIPSGTSPDCSIRDKDTKSEDEE